MPGGKQEIQGERHPARPFFPPPSLASGMAVSKCLGLDCNPPVVTLRLAEQEARGREAESPAAQPAVSVFGMLHVPG